MNLSFSEKLLLALYNELFNRRYAVDDERNYSVGPGILVRHVEMQNTYYLFQNLGIDPQDFGFIWDWRGPSSPELQALLEGLDEKGADIAWFYDNYRLEELLSELRYLIDDPMDKVNTACYLLEEIVGEEMGSEFIAGTIYLANTVYPGSDLQVVNEQLKQRGYHLSYELNQRIWEILVMLGIIRRERMLSTIPKKVLD